MGIPFTVHWSFVSFAYEIVANAVWHAMVNGLGPFHCIVVCAHVGEDVILWLKRRSDPHEFYSKHTEHANAFAHRDPRDRDMGVISVREKLSTRSKFASEWGGGDEVRRGAMSCIAMIWWSMADAIISVQFSTIPFSLCGDCIKCVHCMYPRTVAHTLYDIPTAKRQHQKYQKSNMKTNTITFHPEPERSIFMCMYLPVSDCAIYLLNCARCWWITIYYYYVLRRWWATIRPIYLFIYLL